MAAPKKSAGKKAAKKSTAGGATKKSAAKKTPKKTAGKKTTKQTTKKSDTAKTTKSAQKTTKKSEPSVRSAAEKARGAAGDISVVVASKVKEVMKNLDMRTDSQLVHEVNRRVQDMLTTAAERARENKRSTVRPHDL